MSESTLHRYAAAHAIVAWDERGCRHAAECVRGLPKVFNPKAKPWIATEGASFDALATTIARCPSGALTLLHPDGTLAVASGPRREISPLTTTLLKVRPDGPNVVSGHVVMTGKRSTGAETSSTVVLCRCGESRDKPFCDGTHTRVGFIDSGLLPADAPPGTLPPGQVTITPTPNGPLECSGPLTVQGADGCTTASEATSLCRCGHSRTKPFCDGSHDSVGFKA
jgi:CDGSH-type Zn-finger protein/uncharacterized Fe-S cluster protein YjdI